MLILGNHSIRLLSTFSGRGIESKRWGLGAQVLVLGSYTTYGTWTYIIHLVWIRLFLIPFLAGVRKIREHRWHRIAEQGTRLLIMGATEGRSEVDSNTGHLQKDHVNTRQNKITLRSTRKSFNVDESRWGLGEARRMDGTGKKGQRQPEATWQCLGHLPGSM